MNDNGQHKAITQQPANRRGVITDYVLEKSIFSNVFQKDIRHAYIYKKAERIAKVLFLIAPALGQSSPLRDRAQALGVSIVDAAVQAPGTGAHNLSRELLSLASLLSIAKSAGLLSEMNTSIILNEVHLLLEDIAGYDSPRVVLEPLPAPRALQPATRSRPASPVGVVSKGHLSDIKDMSSRKEAILAAIRSKGAAYMKDISAVVRDVSEKTIQRELQHMVSQGVLKKEGERRWTLYSLG